MLAPVLVTPPSASDPLLTLIEAKAHLRVEHNDHDTLIESLVKAATERLDGYGGLLGRALVSQTWRISLADWGCRIRLPLVPVQATPAPVVKYRDSLDAEQTLATSRYGLLADALSPYLRWTGTAPLPSLYGREDAVSVDFVAGYGAASAVPEIVKQIVRLTIGHWYAHAEAVVTGTIATELPLGANALLYQLRRGGI